MRISVLAFRGRGRVLPFAVRAGAPDVARARARVAAIKRAVRWRVFRWRLFRWRVIVFAREHRLEVLLVVATVLVTLLTFDLVGR